MGPPSGSPRRYLRLADDSCLASNVEMYYYSFSFVLAQFLIVGHITEALVPHFSSVFDFQRVFLRYVTLTPLAVGAHVYDRLPCDLHLLLLSFSAVPKIRSQTR